MVNWLGTLCAVPLPSAGWHLCAAAAPYRRDLLLAQPACQDEVFFFFPCLFFFESEPKVMISFSKIAFVGLIET